MLLLLAKRIEVIDELGHKDQANTDKATYGYAFVG